MSLELNPSTKAAFCDPHPGFAWTDDSERVPVAQFDYDAVDAALGNAAPLDADDAPPRASDRRAAAAEGLASVLAWACEVQTIHAMTVRFVAMVAAVRPELLNGKTYKQLAAELHCTKQNISKTVVRFERKFGFKSVRTRPLSGRENMRRARLGGPCRRKDVV